MARAVELSGGPSKLATALGVSAQAVIFWRDGKRRFPVELGAAIEGAVEGRVRRWDLWPLTWHLIWPELIGSEGAPDVPQEMSHAG